MLTALQCDDEEPEFQVCIFHNVLIHEGWLLYVVQGGLSLNEIFTDVLAHTTPPFLYRSEPCDVLAIRVCLVQMRKPYQTPLFQIQICGK
jgi:hypothetical protein